MRQTSTNRNAAGVMGGSNGSRRHTRHSRLTLVLLADHKARDVVQEDERDAPLRAERDEVRGLLRGRGKHDPVVRDESDGDAVDVRPRAHHRGAEQRLELVQLGAVDDARHHLSAVVVTVRGLRVRDAQQLLGVVVRLGAGARGAGRGQEGEREDGALVGGEGCYELSALAHGLDLALREVLAGPRRGGVHASAAQLLVRALLARGHLHELAPRERELRVALHHDSVVGHAGQVGSSRNARTEHHRDRGDLRLGHARQAVERARPCVEDVEGLAEVGARGLEELDEREAALHGHLVEPVPLLAREQVQRPRADRGHVRDDHALHPAHQPDSADERVALGVALLVLSGQGHELEEGRVLVQHELQPLAPEHLALLQVRLLAVVLTLEVPVLELVPELLDEAEHRRLVLEKGVPARVDGRLEPL